MSASIPACSSTTDSTASAFGADAAPAFRWLNWTRLRVAFGSWTTGQKALLGVTTAFALFVSFYQLGSFRTLTSHETYLAVSTREMLASGDWIVPHFGGLPRLTKPPLGYWSAAACSWLCGGETTEFSTRLPSALSGIALVALIGWWGARWYGRSAGLCAALIQATSLHHLLHAREATVDMLQSFLMTLAMCLIGMQPTDESPARARGRWLGIYLLLGILALAKFHFGPVLVLAPVVVCWCVQRRGRAFLNLCNPLGILVCVGLSILWPALILRQIPEAFNIWQHETVGRAMGEMTPEPWWYFLPLIPYLMLPWSFLLLPLAAQVWQRSRQTLLDPAESQRRSNEQFLWLWIIVQVVLLSLSSNKHKNYLIQALPAVALLLGPILLRCREWRIETRWWVPVTVSVLIVAAGMIGAAVTAGKWPALQSALLSAVGVSVLAGVAITWLVHLGRMRAAAVVAAATYAGCLAVVLTWITPGRDHRLPSAQFAQHVREELPQETLRVFHMGQTPVVFYLGLPVERVESMAELRAELKRTPDLYLVGIRSHLDGLRLRVEADLIEEMPQGHPNTTHQTDDLVLLRVRERR